MTLKTLDNLDFAVDKILSYRPGETKTDAQTVIPSGRKRLNDLNGKEWVKSTKSVWMEAPDRKRMQSIEAAMQSGVLLSESPPVMI
jgi:hypothetical protein